MPDQGRLKDFALALHDRQGVAPACLLLQDRAGVDVDVLLWAVWQACRGRSLGDADVRAAQAHVAEWSRQVVAPLRAVRRVLKMPPLADVDGSGRLRGQLQGLELEAEFIELALLEQRGRDCGLPSGSGIAAGDLAIRNGMSVVSCYSGREPLEVEREAVRLIALSATMEPS